MLQVFPLICLFTFHILSWNHFREELSTLGSPRKPPVPSCDLSFILENLTLQTSVFCWCKIPNMEDSIPASHYISQKGVRASGPCVWNLSSFFTWVPLKTDVSFMPKVVTDFFKLDHTLAYIFFLILITREKGSSILLRCIGNCVTTWTEPEMSGNQANFELWGVTSF